MNCEFNMQTGADLLDLDFEQRFRWMSQICNLENLSEKLLGQKKKNKIEKTNGKVLANIASIFCLVFVFCFVYQHFITSKPKLLNQNQMKFCAILSTRHQLRHGGQLSVLAIVSESINKRRH